MRHFARCRTRGTRRLLHRARRLRAVLFREPGGTGCAGKLGVHVGTLAMGGHAGQVPFVLTWSEQKTAAIATAHASHRPLSRDQRREALCVHARGASAWLRDAARRPSGSLAAQRSASPVKNAFTWADALRLARAILSGSTIRPVPAQAAFTSSNCCSSIYISVLAISGSVAIRTVGPSEARDRIEVQTASE